MTTQTRNDYEISEDWLCYEFYDDAHDRWRWTLVYTPTDESYCWMSGCGMPVDQITPEVCLYIAEMLDAQNCNVCIFHPFSWYVEQAQREIEAEDEEGEECDDD